MMLISLLLLALLPLANALFEPLLMMALVPTIDAVCFGEPICRGVWIEFTDYQSQAVRLAENCETTSSRSLQLVHDISKSFVNLSSSNTAKFERLVSRAMDQTSKAMQIVQSTISPGAIRDEVSTVMEKAVFDVDAFQEANRLAVKEIEESYNSIQLDATNRVRRAPMDLVKQAYTTLDVGMLASHNQKDLPRVKFPRSRRTTADDNEAGEEDNFTFEFDLSTIINIGLLAPDLADFNETMHLSSHPLARSYQTIGQVLHNFWTKYRPFSNSRVRRHDDDIVEPELEDVALPQVLDHMFCPKELIQAKNEIARLRILNGESPVQVFDDWQTWSMQLQSDLIGQAEAIVAGNIMEVGDIPKFVFECVGRFPEMSEVNAAPVDEGMLLLIVAIIIMMD